MIDRLLRHAKDGCEVAPHKSRWDRKTCKRNKGGPHDMVLVKDVLKAGYEYRSWRVPGFHVHESRPFQWRDREWRCSFCNKKEVTYSWTSEREYVGDWTECRRVPDKRQP